MPRDRETLLDKSSPRFIVEAMEMGEDAGRGIDDYIAAVERVADACDDWAMLERLCYGSVPIYTFALATDLVNRKDYRELQPWLRDVAIALRAERDRIIAAAVPANVVGTIGRWL